MLVMTLAAATGIVRYSMRFKKPKNALEGHGKTAPGVSDIIEESTIPCEKCKKMILTDELENALFVCPYCRHHFKMNARQRIHMISDSGTFEEFDMELEPRNVLDFPGYEEKLEAAQRQSSEKDSVVCGTCEINGLKAAIFVMEPFFMMGSMGSVAGEKITRTFERALSENIPVIGYAVSGGARMQEGMVSLMQMAKTGGAVKRHNDAGNLYVCVLTDPTTGGVTASFAMESDIALSEPQALIGFAGPRVIEQTIRKRLPHGFQRAEFQLEHGFIDDIVHRRQQKAYISKLLQMHDEYSRLLRASEEPQSCKTNKGSKTASHLSTNEESNAKKRRSSKKEKQTATITKAYDKVLAARAKSRATSLDFINSIFSDFTEMHGDRRFADDRAIVAGIAYLDNMPVTVIGIEKGHSIKERSSRNFGSSHPEGYRKALRQMKLAEKFNRPVICFVDTSGAYCGIGAEERGQGQAIAENLMEMMALKTPIITIIIGEGGSGGALALSVANEVWMLENSIYSVISPEGCASILWKDSSRAEEASECLKLTAENLLELNIIEKIIQEDDSLNENLKTLLISSIDKYTAMPTGELLEQRYNKFRIIN